MALPRTLEPESMDSEEDVLAYEAMNHQAVNEQFVRDLRKKPIGTRVIDLGCGPAAIPILLCEADDSVEVMAIDSAVEMLERAKLEIEMSGMLGRVQLEHADAKKLEAFPDDMADAVISNSLIHHLAQPKPALAHAIRLVRPGGRLFIRDLVRPDSEQEVESLVKTHAGEEAKAAQQLLRQSFHAALTLQEIRDLVGELGIESTHVQMTSDRHWTIDWNRPEKSDSSEK